MVDFKFVPATIDQAPLHMLLHGVAGSGKTKTALEIATGLVGADGRIALIDTEGMRSKMYAAQYKYDVVYLQNFDPRLFSECLTAAINGGYHAIILDSASHEWMGSGGALEMVDQLARASRSGNKFTEGWGTVTPLHQRFVESIVQCPLHIIVTVRDKESYAYDEQERKPKKLGLQPVQRDGFEYEFDLVATMDPQHNMIVTKAAGILDPLDGQMYAKPDRKIGEWIGGILKTADTKPIPPEAIVRKPAPPTGQTPQPTKVTTTPTPVSDANKAKLLALYKDVHGCGDDDAARGLGEMVEKGFRHGLDALTVEEWAKVMTRLQEEKKLAKSKT